jgi:hypothetical protein
LNWIEQLYPGTYDRPVTCDVSLRVNDDRGNSYTETGRERIQIIESGWNPGLVFEGAWQALLTSDKGRVSLPRYSLSSARFGCCLLLSS